EVGKPLSELQTPRQLVHVVRDIAVALEALYDRNILHRDISEGNILLSAEPDPVAGDRAFLTDFGLAMKLDPTTKLPSPDSAGHNHITGTLPFVAAIFHCPATGQTPLSMIHHDVESLFWVAMYTVFRCASLEGSQNTPKKELDVIQECNGWLGDLRSSGLRGLYATKKLILSFGEEVRLPGRWLSIRNFLSKVAALCETQLRTALTSQSLEINPDPKNHDIGAIITEAEAVDGDSSVGLDQPAPPRNQVPQLPISGLLFAPQPRGSSEQRTSTSTRSKRLRKDDDAGYYGRRGGDLGSRERSKRNRTGPSYQESP
ncbi:hypothetical protein FRC01_014504, partial [Tulasnella sp. 417]